MSKKQNRSLNIIKLFMVRGSEYFYTNYYWKRGTFLGNSRVSNEEVKRVIDFTQYAVDYNKEGLINDDETIECIMKNYVLRDVLEVEEDLENADRFKIEYLEDIANCIIGNIGPMYEIVNNEDKLSEEIPEDVSRIVYLHIAKMFTYIYDFE